MVVAVKHRQLDVFQRGGAREQVEALEDEADLLVADVGQLVAVERRNVHAVQQIIAAGRAVEAADHVHQRGFARAAGAHEGDKFAGQDFQRHAAHGMHLHLAGVIGLVDVFEFDDGIHLMWRTAL